MSEDRDARDRAHPLTALYVPGDRPDRFDKAAKSGADLVILDLEDAVADANKALALDLVVAWLLSDAERPEVQVRVNAGAHHEISTLAATGAAVGVRVPKVEDPADLTVLAGLAGDLPLTALIESARGLQRAGEIAAHPAVAAVALGEADLTSELGGSGRAVVDYARLSLLVAARAAGLPAPMMSVYPAVQDLDGLREDTRRGKALGLRGRACVHPKQLAVVREVFAPTAEELAWAEAVVNALEHGGVATLSNGDMVDPAMLGRARSILDR